MVAAYNGDREYHDEPAARCLPAANVTSIARANLETIRDHAIEEIEAVEGERAALDLIDTFRSDPERVAWYARSYGYQEGRADAAREIATLQARVASLETHSLSERLFGAMLRLDERLSDLGGRFDALQQTLGGVR